MKNKSLVALLVGLLIPTVIAPVLGEIAEVVINFFEIIKGGQIKRITEINIENTKLAAELENEECECCTNAIGFEVPSVTEDDDDEEYYEDE